ncbi:hypothetical protein O181_029766 [Austropuccinia psidii MF-1]|uniref:Uncharacterized protein n=1 Tax=Austropuccinia psidii MF-1 TaxID=1389203 RepID=A0A9Q3CRM9_9BASI|nr:hypothetical protein [Austropuccinia psidii MF-1]
MLSFSLLIQLVAFFLAPTLVVLRKSTDDVELPADPNAKVKTYRTNKTESVRLQKNHWLWTLDGGGDLQIKTGWDTTGWFTAYVNNERNNRFVTVKIRSGKVKCYSSQTYFANVTDKSQNIIEQFDFKLFTRGIYQDRWHFLKGKSLQEKYVFFRRKHSLSGPIKQQGHDQKDAHIHSDDYQQICSISTNDVLPIDYLIALHTCGDNRRAACSW